jgi:phosphopantothenoylcysteine synthetase/decarboxylase
MKVIVTCGPSFEPIDEVRRLTNFSSGELGVMLSESLAKAGHEVFCLKGSGATHRDPQAPCVVQRFDTNDDLLGLLRELAEAQRIGAVFQVAALCDYKVRRVTDDRGDECRSAKIASRSGALRLELEPATKVLPQMRGLFPDAILVGWKYELAGTQDEAVARAERQVKETGVTACIVNGRAFGPGFGLYEQGRVSRVLKDKSELAEFLPAWLARQASVVARV